MMMKKEEKMNTDRKIAIIAGALFIIATAASLLGTGFTGSILGAPDYLTRISANGNPIMVGALLSFIAAAVSSSIAVSLYPVLRKYNEGLALGSVGFRLIEGVFYIVGIICLLSLFTLSQNFVNAGGQGASYFQALGHFLLTARDLADFVVLPSQSYPEGIVAESLSNLTYPLDWQAVITYTGLPAII